MLQIKMARELERVSEETAEASSQPQSPLSHDEIARLAHSYWLKRGDEPCSPEQDWLRAERDLQEAAVRKNLAKCPIGAELSVGPVLNIAEPETSMLGGEIAWPTTTLMNIR
jgi:hypothetical protein